jgi:hypothetical protein
MIGVIVIHAWMHADFTATPTFVGETEADSPAAAAITGWFSDTVFTDFTLNAAP